MNSEQAQQLLTLVQSQYTADLDIQAQTHNALAYAQYQSTVVEFGVLIVLVGLIIICCLLRPTEQL